MSRSIDDLTTDLYVVASLLNGITIDHLPVVGVSRGYLSSMTKSPSSPIYFMAYNRHRKGYILDEETMDWVTAVTSPNLPFQDCTSIGVPPTVEEMLKFDTIRGMLGKQSTMQIGSFNTVKGTVEWRAYENQLYRCSVRVVDLALVPQLTKT